MIKTANWAIASPIECALLALPLPNSKNKPIPNASCAAYRVIRTLRIIFNLDISSFMAGVEGIEPPAFGFGDRRSSQLSYTPTKELTPNILYIYLTSQSYNNPSSAGCHPFKVFSSIPKSDIQYYICIKLRCANLH